MRGCSIVFLDAGTVDYGDISLAALKKLGDFKAYSHTASHQIEKRSVQAQVLITNKCRLDERLLTRLKSLKLVCIAATGTNNIDLGAARRLGIAVTNVSGYSTECVVQFTFAFLLALASRLVSFNQAAHEGRWSRSRFFTLTDFPFQEIDGKTLGIVGHGRIGKRVAQVARALGMKVLITRIPGRIYASKQKRVSFDALIRRSDFVTLHAPLTPLTRNLINSKVLKKMKRGALSK